MHIVIILLDLILFLKLVFWYNYNTNFDFSIPYMWYLNHYSLWYVWYVCCVRYLFLGDVHCDWMWCWCERLLGQCGCLWCVCGVCMWWWLCVLMWFVCRCLVYVDVYDVEYGMFVVCFFFKKVTSYSPICWCCCCSSNIITICKAPFSSLFESEFVTMLPILYFNAHFAFYSNQLICTWT